MQSLTELAKNFVAVGASASKQKTEHVVRF